MDGMHGWMNEWMNVLSAHLFCVAPRFFLCCTPSAHLLGFFSFFFPFSPLCICSPILVQLFIHLYLLLPFHELHIPYHYLIHRVTLLCARRFIYFSQPFRLHSLPFLFLYLNRFLSIVYHIHILCLSSPFLVISSCFTFLVCFVFFPFFAFLSFLPPLKPYFLPADLTLANLLTLP